MQNKRFRLKLKKTKDIELFLRKVAVIYFTEINRLAYINEGWLHGWCLRILSVANQPHSIGTQYVALSGFLYFRPLEDGICFESKI